jgi:DNA-binding MurR/RpiR family transcriptional regulator
MFYEKLEENRYKLNENEEEILEYLLNLHEKVTSMTIREVATQFYTVPNTIVRMTQKLGFEGFSQFKSEMSKTLTAEENMIEITSLDEKIVKTKQLLNKEVVKEIVHCLHEAENILFFAVGLSRFPAEEFSERLKIIGKRSQTFIDPHVMKHNAKLLTKRDVAIAISLSGQASNNVLAATTRANVAGAKTISLTGFSANKLAHITDYQLYGYTSETRIDGIDAADRFSLHYLVNVLYNEYLHTFHYVDKEISSI